MVVDRSMKQQRRAVSGPGSSDPVNDGGSKRCGQELEEGVCICER